MRKGFEYFVHQQYNLEGVAVAAALFPSLSLRDHDGKQSGRAGEQN